MRGQLPETSEAQVTYRIAEMLQHPKARLDSGYESHKYTLWWKLEIPDEENRHSGLIVATSDWDRFYEIVSRVLELRKRKAAGIAKPGATVHIARSGVRRR